MDMQLPPSTLTASTGPTLSVREKKGEEEITTERSVAQEEHRSLKRKQRATTASLDFLHGVVVRTASSSLYTDTK